MNEQSIFTNYAALIQKRKEIEKALNEEYNFIIENFSKWKVGDMYKYYKVINGVRYREMRVENVNIRAKYPSPGYEIVYTCYPFPGNEWGDRFNFSEKELLDNIAKIEKRKKNRKKKKLNEN